MGGPFRGPFLFMQIKGLKFLNRFGINAIVLYPFVIFADKYPSAYIINHENIHLAQIRELGCFRFYYSYIAQYIRFRRFGKNHDSAYRLISFEQEAFLHQHNLAYLSGGREKGSDKISS